MFSIFAKIIDKTQVSFDEKDRFSELKKIYNSAMSKVGMTLVLSLFIIVAGAMTWYKGLHPAPAKFFIIPAEKDIKKDSNGNISVEELGTSTSPRMSTQRVQSWVQRSLTEVLNLNFSEYDKQLENARLVFREDAYEMFRLKMGAKGSLGAEIKEKRLITSLTPTSEVMVLAQDKIGDKRLWKMQMTGFIDMSGATSTLQVKPFRFDFVVEEVPTSVNPFGLAIASFDMDQGDASTN